MNFRRAAKRLLERQVLVDTVKTTYKGRLKAVEKDYIVLGVLRKNQDHMDLFIIRIDEIIALSPL